MRLGLENPINVISWPAWKRRVGDTILTCRCVDTLHAHGDSSDDQGQRWPERKEEQETKTQAVISGKVAELLKDSENDQRPTSEYQEDKTTNESRVPEGTQELEV